jgi:hypothetical protein
MKYGQFRGIIKATNYFSAARFWTDSESVVAGHSHE